MNRFFWPWRRPSRERTPRLSKAAAELVALGVTAEYLTALRDQMAVISTQVGEMHEFQIEGHLPKRILKP